MAAGTIGDVKLLAPLRERDFALLWTGMTVSLLGDGIFIVAEAWQVYDIHNDPVALSLVGAACIWGLRVRSLPVVAIERSARRELGDAVAFVRSQPWLWSTLVAASLSLLLFLRPLEVLLPFVVRNDLDTGAGGYGAILAAAGAGSVITSLIVSQRGPPRRYLTFAYGMWTVSTVAFIAYAVGTALWQCMAFAVLFGACETAGMVVWGTLMSSRVPPDLRGRVHSLDWFVSIGLTPVSFALAGPVSKAIGVDATLVVAGVAPMIVCVVLYLAAGLRRDEELHPLLAAPVVS
jgi:MFS family permease